MNCVAFCGYIMATDGKQMEMDGFKKIHCSKTDNWVDMFEEPKGGEGLSQDKALLYRCKRITRACYIKLLSSVFLGENCNDAQREHIMPKESVLPTYVLTIRDFHITVPGDGNDKFTVGGKRNLVAGRRSFRKHLDIDEKSHGVAILEDMQCFRQRKTKIVEKMQILMNESGCWSTSVPSEEENITYMHGLSETGAKAKLRHANSFRQMIKTEACKWSPIGYSSKVTMFFVPLMGRYNENNRTKLPVDTVSDSNGYISIKSCNSNASANSLISVDEESIIYENDLSERGSESAPCSYSECKKSNGNKGNYKCTTKTRKRSKELQKAYSVRDLEGVSSLYPKTSKMASTEAREYVNMSQGRRKQKRNRNSYGRVMKRRGKTNTVPGCCRLKISFIGPMYDKFPTIVKPQLLQEEQEDRESDSTGFVSVKSFNSKGDANAKEHENISLFSKNSICNGNIRNEKLALVNKQDDTDGFNSPGVGNPDHIRNKNTRNQRMGFVEMKGKNPLKCMTDSKTKVEQWLKSVTSVTNQTESSDTHKTEKAKTHIHNSVDEKLGPEEHVNHMYIDTKTHLRNKQAVLSGAFVGEHAAEYCEMAGGTTLHDNISAFDDNISAFKSHGLDEIENCNNVVKTGPFPELFIGNKHPLDKSRNCDLMTACAETFEREKGQLPAQISESPPLPDPHRGVHVVI